MATIRFYPGLGYGGMPAGSFAGKETSLSPAIVITQFWAGLGFGGMRYGSFAGKEASSPNAQVDEWIVRARRRGRR